MAEKVARKPDDNDDEQILTNLGGILAADHLLDVILQHVKGEATTAENGEEDATASKEGTEERTRPSRS